MKINLYSREYKVGTYLTALGSDTTLFKWAYFFYGEENREAYAPWGIMCGQPSISIWPLNTYPLFNRDRAFPITFGSWERFTAYMAAENSDEVKLATSILGWVDGVKVTLQTAHNKFVAAQPDGGVLGDRDVAGPWEVFTVEKVK